MEMFSIILTSLLSAMYFVTIAHADTRVKVTSPVSPVRESGILSVHCHVLELSENQEVTISHRANGKTTRLTWGEGVVTNAEDRVFLAIRQLQDGSVVYFLSIVDAERRDGGEYSCRVFNSDDMDEVAADIVDILIQYFPVEPFPLCTPNEMIVVHSGSRLTLNCTSEAGYPHVDIKWSRTGTDVISPSHRVIQDGVAYSELHLTLTTLDNEAVFLCQVSSHMFPDRFETCHVGPIMVIPSKNEHIKPPVITDREGTNASPTRKSNLDLKTREVSSRGHDCQKLCNFTSSQSTFTWIVATCIAGLVALVFCIVGVVISIKLYRLPTPEADDSFHRECIYEDVDRRCADNKVYMALKTSGRSEKNTIPSGMHTGDHYAITLCRPVPNL